MAGPLSEAEMARAVQRGIRSEKNKQFLGTLFVLIGIVLAVGFAALAWTLFHDTTAQIVAGIFGFLLPFLLWGKHV